MHHQTCAMQLILVLCTFGQLLRFTRNLWYALPAFSSGFSVRPPPATWPTIARHVLGSTCRCPTSFKLVDATTMQ